MKELNSNQDKLYKGLPCIWDGEKFILFLPHTKKIIALYHNQLMDLTIREIVEEINFNQKTRAKINKEIAKTCLALTTHCNMSCKYCYVENKDKPLFMNPDFAIRCIKGVIKSFTRKIFLSFFGGEPTLNMSALESSVSYVKSLGIDAKYHIVTNGVIPDKVLNYLINNEFSITVSMDGIPEVNEDQRLMKNKRRYSNLIEKTIKRLSRAKTNFQVRMTITQLNVNRMSDAIEYFASLGAKFVHFEPVCIENVNIQPEFSIPNEDVYIRNVKKALDSAEKTGIYIINSAYMNLLTPSDYFCTTIGNEKFLFTPDGGVSLCYRIQSLRDSLQNFLVGKYDRTNDKFIMDNFKLKKFRNIKIDTFKECKECFAKYICGGGCPYRNFIQTGSFQKVDKWMCYVKKNLIHDAIIRMFNSSKVGKESVVLGTSIFEY